MAVEKLDLRCPHGPKALLAKVVQDGDPRQYVDEGTLLELNCRDCAKAMRANGEPDVARVLHRYNVIGELVNSVVERKRK